MTSINSPSKLRTTVKSSLEENQNRFIWPTSDSKNNAPDRFSIIITVSAINLSQYLDIGLTIAIRSAFEKDGPIISFTAELALV